MINQNSRNKSETRQQTCLSFYNIQSNRGLTTQCFKGKLAKILKQSFRFIVHCSSACYHNLNILVFDSSFSQTHKGGQC